MQPYNTRCRLYRKALHQFLGTKSLVSKFNSLQELEARRLLRRMLDDPGEWVQHLKTYVTHFLFLHVNIKEGLLNKIYVGKLAPSSSKLGTDTTSTRTGVII